MVWHGRVAWNYMKVSTQQPLYYSWDRYVAIVERWTRCRFNDSIWESTGLLKRGTNSTRGCYVELELREYWEDATTIYES